MVAARTTLAGGPAILSPSGGPFGLSKLKRELINVMSFVYRAHRCPEESLMRILTLVFLTIVVGWVAHPAKAQTFDPNYPVCLHLYDIGGDRMECSFTSIAQCAASASGRSAVCMTNPYFAQEDGGPGPARQRRR
jgi:Protein of unknown function (DUF3551)